MDRLPKNLFPENVKDAAEAIFGMESLQPVLLKIEPTATVGSDPGQSELSLIKLLTSNEARIFLSYKLPKRRAEYLTGRICAKMAIANYITGSGSFTAPVLMKEVEIISDTNGRPFAHLHQLMPLSMMDISIAHSINYGVALASRSICGIDIQRQAETLLRVRDRYCTEAEYKLLQHILPAKASLTRLALLWAAKEAVKKAASHWRMPGFLDIEMTALERELNNCVSLSFIVKGSKNRHIPKTIKVVTGMFTDYSIAICIMKEGSSDA